MDQVLIKTTNEDIKPSNRIKVWELPGGVHPPENKAQSMQEPLGEFSIPPELVFPLNQHIGAPASPIVSVGDYVKAGQKIAEAVGLFSASIHASTSGTITGIEERLLPHSSGMTGQCIILESDGHHKSIDFKGCDDYQALTPDELVNKIRDAGIAGLGGAGFPTAIKLTPNTDHPIDTLILNGTECEPYITADDCLMQTFPEEVVKGAQLLSYLLGEPKRIIIGIEDNKPDAITAIRESAKDTNIDVVSFPTKYPSGGEKQLIQILTGKEVPSGQIPAKLGIVLQNVGTAVAAFRAVTLGEPLTWRITTVVGQALKRQRNVKTLLGTPVNFLLENHGFDAMQNPQLIMGGPMMGFALPDSAVPVVKTTNCIIAPSHQEMPPTPPAQACIRCGLCAEACPVSLLPQQMYWYARAEEFDRLQNHNLFDCIECGACAFVCPSSIPLVQYYRSAKGTIRQQEQEKIKSDHARQRFEFRKQRLEAEEQERQAKRQARKEAAEAAKRLAAEKAAQKKAAENESTSTKTTDNTDTTPADPVAAAMARVQAKTQDPAAQQAKLERSVTSAQSRVDRLNQQLETVEDDKKEKLLAQLKQAEVRLADAKKSLGDHKKQAENPTISDNETIVNTREKKSISTRDKLQTQVDSLNKRVEKAREKIITAEAEGSEQLEALKKSLGKMEEKLAKTTQALESHQ